MIGSLDLEVGHLLLTRYISMKLTVIIQRERDGWIVFLWILQTVLIMFRKRIG